MAGKSAFQFCAKRCRRLKISPRFQSFNHARQCESGEIGVCRGIAGRKMGQIHQPELVLVLVVFSKQRETDLITDPGFGPVGQVIDFSILPQSCRLSFLRIR